MFGKANRFFQPLFTPRRKGIGIAAAGAAVVLACFWLFHAKAGAGTKGKLSLADAVSVGVSASGRASISSASSAGETASGSAPESAALSSAPAASEEKPAGASDVSAARLTGRASGERRNASDSSMAGAEPSRSEKASSETRGPADGNGSDGSSGGDSGSGNADSAPRVKNYQGVSRTMYFTDEITHIRQKAEFLGIGAGYKEVAAANLYADTTSQMAEKHWCWDAVYTVTSNHGHRYSLKQPISSDGKNAPIIDGDLTAGNYTVQVLSSDGTKVAQFHFTVDSSGIVH